MLVKRHFCAVAVMAAMAAANEAAAEVITAVAELKQVHIELIDLDPNDGIAPSLTFASLKPMGVFASATPGAWPDNFLSEVVALGGALTGQVTSAAPSTALQVQIGAGDIYALGLGPSFRLQGSAITGASVFSFASLSAAATLSPHTRLVLSGAPGELAASGNVQQYYATASVSTCALTAGGQALCYDSVTNTDHSVSQGAFVANASSWVGESHPASLSVTWDNDSSVQASRWISAGVGIYLAPVPEPGSLAMLATGLFVLWPKLRRIRRPGGAAG